jgi:hypothetical protein
MRSLLFLLIWVCSAPVEFTYQSEIKDVSIQDTKMTPRGFVALIANKTTQPIILLRGIMCVRREPGTDLENPGEGCREIYFDDNFPPSKSTWSNVQCLRLDVRSGDTMHIRLIKIQSVHVY